MKVIKLHIGSSALGTRKAQSVDFQRLSFLFYHICTTFAQHLHHMQFVSLSFGSIGKVLFLIKKS